MREQCPACGSLTTARICCGVPLNRPFVMDKARVIALRRCWTLFLFGPKRREWGFHCEGKGWVPWQEFTAAGKPGEVGKGCDS